MLGGGGGFGGFLGEMGLKWLRGYARVCWGLALMGGWELWVGVLGVQRHDMLSSLFIYTYV